MTTRSPDAALSDRNGRVHALFDASVGRGLEVGPLFMPVVTKAHADVRYVDIYDRERLVEHYRSHVDVPVDDICEPDYLLLGPDGDARPLSEAVKAGAPYDWVVASHVAEHVPDLIGWLWDVAAVLLDEGCLVLVIPDRRACFDVERTPTTVGMLLDAHERRDVRPTTRAVYDHFSRCRQVDTRGLWEGTDPGPRMYGPEFVSERLAEVARGEYVDCHVWTWSPGEFVAQMDELWAIGAVPFAVDAALTTPCGDLEFYVRLVHVRPGAPLPPGHVRAIEDRPLFEPIRPPHGRHDGHVYISAREQQLVLGKRRFVEWTRHLRRQRLTTPRRD